MSEKKHKLSKDSEFKWNVPNAICVFRMIGSLFLIPLALLQLRYAFLATYLVLAFTDWIDGVLARRWKQKSALGAKLDTYADATLNLCLLAGVFWLCWQLLLTELLFIGIAVASYLVSSLYCLIKFRKLPAYHSYAAKLSQFLVVIAGIFLVLEWSVWPLRIAAISVFLTNIETTMITAKLDVWQTDVLSIFKLHQNRRTPEG